MITKKVQRDEVLNAMKSLIELYESDTDKPCRCSLYEAELCAYCRAKRAYFGATQNLGKDLKKPRRMVHCITTDEVFKTIRDASRKYSVNDANITKCCKGELESAGKFEGKKLVWRYVN